MVIYRGEIYWTTLARPVGSIPAGHRPVVIVQADRFNNSPLATVVVATLTTNLKLGHLPGNVYLKAKLIGLPEDSVVNVSQIATINKASLDNLISSLPEPYMLKVENGIKLMLGML